MDHCFVRCISYDMVEKYIFAGLVPDYENDLFVRRGYGALCFCCGSCSTLNEVIKVCKVFDNYYDFPEKIKKGYRFVIGPGVNAMSNKLGLKIVDNAVYCINYEEILEKSNGFCK